MQSEKEKPQCIKCLHFHNTPELLESEFKGLTALSSAYGSVRCQDGLCDVNDIYIAANRCCSHFEPFL